MSHVPLHKLLAAIPSAIREGGKQPSIDIDIDVTLVVIIIVDMILWRMRAEKLDYFEQQLRELDDEEKYKLAHQYLIDEHGDLCRQFEMLKEVPDSADYEVEGLELIKELMRRYRDKYGREIAAAY